MSWTRYLAAALVLIAMIAGVQAAAIVVAPSGGDYATLQQAVDAALPDDVIELRAGSYPGGVVVAKPVTIRGDGGAVIGSGTDQAGLMIEADGVAVRGVGIEGPATGIFLRNSGEFSIRQCSFKDCDVGVVAEGCSNGTVQDNSFASVGAAFLGMGTADTIIRDSSFEDVTQYIQFYAASGCRVEAESLAGPEYFAADIFSDTEYTCGPWIATGWDFALLGAAYEAPAGYTLLGEAADISFIEKAESGRRPQAVLNAGIVTDEGERYGFYRVDGGSPVLVSETTVDNGTASVQAIVAEAGHYALMERPAGSGEVVIAGIAVLVVAALLIVALLRRRK